MSIATNGAGPVCFDLDGCLVDSREAIATCMNLALEAAGAPAVDTAVLHAFIGGQLLGCFEGLLADAGHDPALAMDCVATYRQHYAEVSLTHTTPIPGIEPVLAAVAAQRRVLVVTAKPAEFAEPILAAVRLDRYVEAVFAPALDALQEPKVASLRRALAAADAVADPGAAWMVGDRHHDVEAGLACGVPAVGVTWGSGDRAELTTAGATAVVDAPDELPAVLGLVG
ncbi:MAG: HAD hydrolase-like protein [Egicoccus sp.]